MHIGIGSLYQEVTVENTGNSPLEFTTALHTYFRVSSIEKVTALSSLTYGGLLFAVIDPACSDRSMNAPTKFFLKNTCENSGNEWNNEPSCYGQIRLSWPSFIERLALKTPLACIHCSLLGSSSSCIWLISIWTVMYISAGQCEGLEGSEVLRQCWRRRQQIRIRGGNWDQWRDRSHLQGSW